MPANRAVRYVAGMPEYRFTEYFEQEVLRKRPYLRREWCIAVLEGAVRVVTLEDRVTIHNAFPDRGFHP